MEKYKRGKHEEPFAVLLSPYQYETISQNRCSYGTKLLGLTIAVARGVYGPVVVTQDAYNAISRNAPEIDLRWKGANMIDRAL